MLRKQCAKYLDEYHCACNKRMTDGAPFGMRLREIPVFTTVSRNFFILPFLERGMHIQIREDGFTRAAMESRSARRSLSHLFLSLISWSRCYRRSRFLARNVTVASKVRWDREKSPLRNRARPIL